ncbi:MAG: PA14 domain-containing protein [Kiritimatiellaeota bacterium]|nr:PA14 domain-containing protein [Kiritimatiellota bacterium]
MNMKCAMVCGILFAGAAALADAPVLTWDGGAVWDAASVSWVDESGAPSAWVQGAVAKFDGAGGMVEVSADVSASGLVFASGGYALVGCGRVRLEGEISVAGGLTNSVGVELFSAGGIAKTGLGAVALGQCVGRVTVSAGDLLAMASQFADARVEVAAGARLVTAGEPDRALNVVRNGGFEGFNMTAGNWQYVSAGAALTEWGVSAEPHHVAGMNLAAGGSAPPWSSVGAAPERDHVLILQYGGAVTQEVTVAQAGWHQVALSHFLRRDYAVTALYVTLDGAVAGMIVNESREFHAGRFVSVPLWLEAGTHLLGVAGESRWGDRASMIDDVVLAPAFASAEACQSLGGESEVSLASGAAAVLGHGGPLAVGKLDVDVGASVSGGGSWSDAAMAGLWFEYAGGAWSPPLTMGEDAFLRVKDSDSDALTTEGLARRVWASDDAVVLLDGEGLTLTNAVLARGARFSVTEEGDVAVNAPLTLRTWTVFDVFGNLEVLDSTMMEAALVSKRGFGSLGFAEPLGLRVPFTVVEGRVSLVNAKALATGDRAGDVFVMSLPGRTAEVSLWEANETYSTTFFFGGAGENVMSTALDGGVVNVRSYSPRTALESALRFEVSGGDTLSIPRLLIWTPGGVVPQGGLLKSGAGVLEICEGGANATDQRTYMGRTVLRNGTLRVLADDTGNTSANGGSLGAGPLADAVWVGDAGTAALDNLTFVASGNKRFIGHDFEVFNCGDAVRFEAADSTETTFAGAFTLHRDVTFAGANDAHLIVGAAASASGAELALEGFERVTIIDALGGNINLDVGGRDLRIGSATVAVSSAGAFAMDGGTLDVAFEGGESSRIDAADITLGVVAFNLCYRGMDVPFGEPGTYTLMTCSGTLSADINDLSVANETGGFDYIFSVAGGALTLTIQDSNPGAFTAWAAKEGGDWGTGANWNPAAAPDSAALAVLMGGAITNHAEVTLASPFTVGALTFSNPSWGYTLAGDTLTLGRLDVLSGSHTILNTLDNAASLPVAVSGGKLTLGDAATVLPQVLLEQGALTIGGAGVTLAAGLDGAPGTALTLEGGSGLTVDQSAAGTFSGTVTGPAGATLTKDGAGKWTLDDYASWYLGAFDLTAGQTVLEGASLHGPVTTAGGSTLVLAPPATNGLMGYYYHIGDRNTLNSYTNAFLSVAGLEAAVAGRTPTLIAPSGLDGETFDYPLATGAALTFPYPFGTDGNGGDGPCQYDFIAVWRGSITLPESGTYSFAVRGDDYPLLAIDGNVIISNNRYDAFDLTGTLDLAAGAHDILLGLGQAGGNAGIRLYICPPSGGMTPTLVPNSWLTPASTLGTLDSKGAVAVQGNANASAGANGYSAVAGSLNTAAGSLLTKTGGGGILDIRSGTKGQAAGDVVVREGQLMVSAEGLLGAPGRMTVGEGGFFAALADQTVGGLEGRGAAMLGYSVDVGVDAFEFINETDSGISAQKVYTHLVDFPLTQNPFATVNGVTFDKNGNWSWAGNVPTGEQSAAGETGIERLLRGFLYGTTDYTITLTGLQPFTAYEFRIYFRAYTLGADREVTFTFTAGANTVGDCFHNIDHDFPRSIVCARYITDAAGTLSIQVHSHNGSHTCHLYAFSNEVLGGGESAGDVTLTLAPPAGDGVAYSGEVSGFGAVVVDGAGTQRFSGANTADGGLAVLGGEAVLESGASVASGAAIAAGGTLTVPHGGITLGGLTGGGTFDLTGAGVLASQGISTHFFTDDASSGISPAKTYTHKLDFGSRDGIPAGNPGASVNTVEFVKAGTSGNVGGYGWGGFGSIPHGGDANTIEVIPSGDGIFRLLRDMTYENSYYPFRDSDPPRIATLTGLTPGQHYEVRIYNRSWSGNTSGTRIQTVGFSADPAVTNTTTFAEDGLLPHYLAYRYTAVTDTLTLVVRSHADNASWHFYGLTNEETEAPATAFAPIDPDAPPTLAAYPQETCYERFFIDDETSQISPHKRYTHKLDFGSRFSVGAVVNGVRFTKARMSGHVPGTGYGWEGFGKNAHDGNDNASVPLSQGSRELMRDMVYNNASNDVARLTGLTPGKTYEVRFYNRSFDNNADPRAQYIRFVPDPATTNEVTFSCDTFQPRFLAYRYTPTGSTLTILFAPIDPIRTWHIYALTNEEVCDPTLNPAVIDTAADSTFSGDVTGGQCWEKRGPGALTLTGLNTATGPVTVRGGALGTDLNGVATLGPVIVRGGLLFGSGTFGNSVYVTSNAWLHAGTPAACGTLAIAGHLTIEDDTRLDWRYGAKPVADTFTVGGLTFPASGTLHTAPLGSGATPPAKHILFNSATPINGPADFSAWEVEGVKGAKLEYNTSRTQILFRCSRGTVLILK